MTGWIDALSIYLTPALSSSLPFLSLTLPPGVGKSVGRVVGVNAVGKEGKDLM